MTTTSILQRLLARLMTGPLAQVRLFSHWLLDECEEGVHCEICEHAHKAKLTLPPPGQLLFTPFVIFAGLSREVVHAPASRFARRFSPRAPPG